MHLQKFLHHLFQPQQVNELIISRRRQEVELRSRRFRWRNLQQSLLQLFTQR